MRLVAWNCQEGFERKFTFLRNLDFDVAVVSECAPLAAFPAGEPALSAVVHLPVAGQRKHLGVFAQAPWCVEGLPRDPLQPWLLPVAVTGPADFTLLAVWALSPFYATGLPYVAQVARVVEHVRTVRGPVVVAGDLNAPLASDRRSSAGHAANVIALRSLGLESAFTSAFGTRDPLSLPTYFHRRRWDQPFHIDHVFIPRLWRAGLSMTVGTFEEWVASGRSDHVPLIVDVTPMS